MKAFNEYMEHHNLTYKPPTKSKINNTQKRNNIRKEQKDLKPYQLMKCKYCLETNVVKMVI